MQKVHKCLKTCFDSGNENLIIFGYTLLSCPVCSFATCWGNHQINLKSFGFHLLWSFFSHSIAFFSEMHLGSKKHNKKPMVYQDWFEMCCFEAYLKREETKYRLVNWFLDLLWQFSILLNRFSNSFCLIYFDFL